MLTHYTSWLVGDGESPFSVMVDGFHWFSSERDLMSVYDIPRRGSVPQEISWRDESTDRPPFRIMMSGLAISLLMAVTSLDANIDAFC